MKVALLKQSMAEITRRALARLAIIGIKLANKRLPAFHRTAVEDFVGGGVNFVRLIGLHEFLHVFRIFVIFARNQQVDVRRVFIFHEQTVFRRRQADLAGVGGVDYRQRDLLIVQGTWQLRRFQLNQLQVFEFSVTSSTVGSRPTPSFSLIRPTFCSSSSERPRLVGSLGSAI